MLVAISFRWGSLANDGASLFHLLESTDHQVLQPTSLALAPINSNIYARRHSAHNCSSEREENASMSTVSDLILVY